jgi:hypothetical protein
MIRATSLLLALSASLLVCAPAVAAGPGHVTLHHGMATYMHGGATYTVTMKPHGFVTVTKRSGMGPATPVKVSYRHPGAHNLIYVRNGCIVYIDYDNGAWTGYYYYVC